MSKNNSSSSPSSSASSSSASASALVRFDVLLTTGERHSWVFNPTTSSVAEVKQHIWSSWPSEWSHARPDSPLMLRLLRLGHFWDDDHAALASHNLPLGKTTVVHMLIRSIPPAAACHDDSSGAEQGNVASGSRRFWNRSSRSNTKAPVSSSASSSTGARGHDNEASSSGAAIHEAVPLDSRKSKDSSFSASSPRTLSSSPTAAATSAQHSPSIARLAETHGGEIAHLPPPEMSEVKTPTSPSHAPASSASASPAAEHGISSPAPASAPVGHHGKEARSSTFMSEGNPAGASRGGRGEQEEAEQGGCCAGCVIC
ncbi:hypothetical protein V8E36_003178 [Tilletia maclaganii]